jgi:hypothetical protein
LTNVEVFPNLRITLISYGDFGVAKEYFYCLDFLKKNIYLFWPFHLTAVAYNFIYYFSFF